MVLELLSISSQAPEDIVTSLELPPHQSAVLQSLRYFDYFQGTIRFPRGSVYMGNANRSLHIRGWLGATHGIFLNCWNCDASSCTSERACCGRKPTQTDCFDGVHFTKNQCCDKFLREYDNHPELLTASLYTSLGIEQIYQRLTARRLEHLTSLALPLWNRKVLEVGARQGDLTHYFTDRGCTVTIVEPRMTNVLNLRKKIALGKLFPPDAVSIFSMDLEKRIPIGRWDIVFCFGLLYHLERPLRFLKNVAPLAEDILLLETVVSAEVQVVQESSVADSMALSGRATQLRRQDIFEALKGLFPYVYVPSTQPNHDQFETDWASFQSGARRAIFIAARRPLSSPVALLQELPMMQTRSS